MNEESKNIKDSSVNHKSSYREDIESRFMDQCLNHCRGMISYISNLEQKGEIRSDSADILKIVYLLDYAIENVGSSRMKKFLMSDDFTYFQPLTFLNEWDFKDTKKKIDFLIEKILNNKNQFKFAEKIVEADKNEIIRDVSILWSELKFDGIEKALFREQIKENAKRIYNSIGSDIDKERRHLVRRVVDHSNFNKDDVHQEKIGVLCLAYTNVCKNKCRHCMAYRPMSGSFSFGNSLIDSVLDATYKHGTQFMLFTGGEPFLALDEVTYTIKHSNASQIFITTSGDFAVDSEKNGQTDKTVGKIWDAFCSNKSEKKMGLGVQISMDDFHQEILLSKDDSLRENSSLVRIANLMEVIFRAYPEIRITLMSVRSGVKYSILSYLFNELERRGIDVIDRDEVLVFYSQLISEPAQKGPEILQMEISLKYNDKEIKIYCGAQLISRISGALLLAPWELMDAAHTLKDFEQMKNVDQLAMESNMILIERDGNVYLGGSLAGVWALGNLGEEQLSQIIKYSSFDPLVVAINNDFGQLIHWAKEINPSIESQISSHPTGMEVMNKVFSEPAMRLYLTKRVIIEGNSFPKNLLKDVGLNVSSSDLKDEYINNKN